MLFHTIIERKARLKGFFPFYPVVLSNLLLYRQIPNGNNQGIINKDTSKNFVFVVLLVD
jgi:hypothetical protein